MLRSSTATEKSPEQTEDIDFIKSLIEPDTVERIEEIQQHKLDFVKGLKAWRKKFWEDSESATSNQEASDFEHQKGSFLLTETNDNQFETFLKGGEKITLTKGEVMAASEWGVWWHFADSVARGNQREVMNKQVRAVIADEFDLQLIQLGKENRLSDDRRKETYKKIEEHNLDLDRMPAGILAEKMLMSFLTKEMYDSALPFSVMSVDVYEDVEHKIDFVVTYEGVNRGVKVDDPEKHHTNRIGIQFTLDDSAKKAEQKNRQINRIRATAMKEIEVDELVLIAMPIEHLRKDFESWRNDENGALLSKRKLDPRGPDQFWDEETKKTIIDGLVKGIRQSTRTAA